MDVRFLKEERQIIDSKGTRDQGELPPRQKTQKSLFFPEPRASFDSLWLFSGGDLTCWQEWTVREQQYSYHRLYYVRGGNACYTSGEKKVPLRQGRLYLFPCYPVSYRIEHDPDTPLQVMWCHFELHPNLTEDLIEYDPSSDPQMQMVLALWSQVCTLRQPGNEMYHAVSLLMHLLERRINLHYAQHTFGEIEKYIKEHLSDELSVAELSSRFGYSRSYFSRMFKEAFKMSPGEYVRTIRMSRAAELLVSGITVDEICVRMGYSDKKVFFRAFKSYHGMTTSAYVKNHRAQP